MELRTQRSGERRGSHAAWAHRQAMKRALLAAFALWALGGCASTGADATRTSDSAEAIAPTLWEARGPGGAKLHLLGSVHVGDAAMVEFGPRIEGAFASADELVVEVDVSDLAQEEAVRVTQRYGVIEPPEDLHSRVSKDTWNLLTDYLEGRGQPIAPFNHLEPWLVTMTIAVMEFEALGFDPELGVDRSFLARAADAAKPIVGLESIDGQLSLLASLPLNVQEAMLRDTLEHSHEFRDEALGMIDAWKRGDDASLEEIVFRGRGTDAELDVFYDRVILERNRRMADRLGQLARDGKARFVVVGAGHMIGDAGIPALLASRGFQVSRVD